MASGAPNHKASHEFLGSPRVSGYQEGGDHRPTCGGDSGTHGGTENIMYLDDSNSMMGGNLEAAQRALAQVHRHLGHSPTRVVKFGSHPTEIVGRAAPASISHAIRASWDATSGMTYLWHMIEQDIMERYCPGGGRIRIFIITDGEDNCSPAGYSGAKSMDPMMKTLRCAGFDVEFYIIVLSDYPSGTSSCERYQALASATNGACLHLWRSMDENEPEMRRFLSAVGESTSATDCTDGEASGRHRRRREYERQMRVGRANRFDWYVALSE